jgi:hypothetical protein
VECLPSRETIIKQERHNIHIVDARTFATQVTLPVPFNSDPMSSTQRSPATHRAGVDGGMLGIAGVCFDPTGDFLYTGTERTVVEYDLRTVRKRGLGCGGMA